MPRLRFYTMSAARRVVLARGMGRSAEILHGPIWDQVVSESGGNVEEHAARIATALDISFKWSEAAMNWVIVALAVEVLAISLIMFRQIGILRGLLVVAGISIYSAALFWFATKFTGWGPSYSPGAAMAHADAVRLWRTMKSLPLSERLRWRDVWTVESPELAAYLMADSTFATTWRS